MEHIHLTTRRCFIGPIPEGWLKSHRKSWYSRYLSFSDYSSRAATFSARPGISHQRQITGLDGPSASATLSRSFPQPADVDEESEESDDNTGDSQEEQEQDNYDGKVNELEAQATREETDDGNPTTNHPEEEPPNPKPKRRATFKDRLSPKKSNDKPRSSSFITAPTRQRKSFKSRSTPVSSAQRPLLHRSSLPKKISRLARTQKKLRTTLLMSKPVHCNLPHSSLRILPLAQSVLRSQGRAMVTLPIKPTGIRRQLCSLRVLVAEVPVPLPTSRPKTRRKRPVTTLVRCLKQQRTVWSDSTSPIRPIAVMPAPRRR